jgi:hypothetical protein
MISSCLIIGSDVLSKQRTYQIAFTHNKKASRTDQWRGWLFNYAPSEQKSMIYLVTVSLSASFLTTSALSIPSSFILLFSQNFFS